MYAKGDNDSESDSEISIEKVNRAVKVIHD